MPISRYTAAPDKAKKLPSDTLQTLQSLKGLDDDEEDAGPAPAPAAPPPSTKGGQSTARQGLNPTGRAPGAAPPQQTRGTDTDPADADLDGIISLQERQAAERQAADDQLARSKADQLQQAAARANLGGFGLSGAAASQQASITRQADRTAVETQADLRQQQSDEAFTEQQRLAAIWAQEQADGVDLNDDKVIGPPNSASGRTPEQYAEERQRQERSDLLLELTANNKGKDLWHWDPDNAPGSIERPYVIGSDRRAEMEAAGFTFAEQKVEGVNRVGGGWGQATVYMDNEGNYWYFQ